MLFILFDGYATKASEAKYRATHGKGIKILKPKQMFQRLAIALAQVKAGKTSDNLLKEIRIVFYYIGKAKLLKKCII